MPPLLIGQAKRHTDNEIGFVARLFKKCYGLRTDLLNSDEFDGIPINLRVLYWIESSGGRLFKRIDEISFWIIPTTRLIEFFA
jgi:hypothetical protein